MENNTNQNNKNNKSNTTLNETFAPTMSKPNIKNPAQLNNNKSQTEKKELLFESSDEMDKFTKLIDSNERIVNFLEEIKKQEYQNKKKKNNKEDQC